MLLLRFKGKSHECNSIHHFECPCIIGSKFEKNRKRFVKVFEHWRKKVEEVVNREEFNNQNFTVNLQPFVKNLEFPLKSDGKNTDFSYMATDCFHLSQKGYALGRVC